MTRRPLKARDSVYFASVDDGKVRVLRYAVKSVENVPTWVSARAHLVGTGWVLVEAAARTRRDAISRKLAEVTEWRDQAKESMEEAQVQVDALVKALGKARGRA